MSKPTIVLGTLNDAELTTAIDNLVKHVEDKSREMANYFDSQINRMKASLNSLGNVNINLGGTTNSGGTQKVKKQVDEINQSTKEASATMDKFAQSMEVSNTRNNVLSVYDEQIEKLKRRLIEVRQDIDVFNHAIGTGNKAEVAWGQSGLKQANAEAEQLMITITKLEHQRGNLSNIVAPQGHAIQNYVNSLIKANPELAALNAGYKSNQSILQQQGAEQQKVISYTEEESKKLQTLQERLQQLKNERKELSKAMQDAGWDRFGTKIQLGAYPNDANLKDKLADAESRYAAAKQKMAQIDKEIVSIETELNGVRSKFVSSTQQGSQAQQKATNAMNQTRESIMSLNQAVEENRRRSLSGATAMHDYGASAVANFSRIKEAIKTSLENTPASEPVKASMSELTKSVGELYNAYMRLSEAEKNSPMGEALKKQVVQAMALRKALEQNNKLVLGLQLGDNAGADKTLGSYINLSRILKDLTDQYKQLGRAERDSEKGQALADKIQRTSRALQQFQAQMNRPTSLDKALKLPEKTLDEIAYKMQMLSNYRANLNIFDPKQKEEIDAVNKALEKLRLEQSKIMGQNKEMLASNNALVRSFNYMKNRLAFYFTVGASTQFIKQLIDIRSQYEMNERALGILINSAERGSQIFSELSQMALISPYTLIELSAAAKQLVAYDIAAKDVVDTTRRLADMASAVGVPMERLTYALGQIKAYGYLNSRDARMFANAGIPLVKQLSDYYTQLEGKIVSTADVYDRMKKKAIDYNDVMAVVTKMTDEGGKFFDFQAKMAETLKVRLANLTLAWNNMLNEIGENEQGILSSTIGGLKELFLHWKDIDAVIKNLLVTFGIWKTVQALGLMYIGELNTAMGAQVLLGQKLGKTLTSAAAATKSFFTGYGLAATAFLYLVADSLMTWWRNVEEVEKLNTTIADGAKEASEALDKMLHSSEMVEARLNAINGKLSSSDATKAWERIREQLELSALTSKDLIAQLMLEPDLNKRVAESFTLAEKVQEATSKLSDLNDALDYTQDSVLSGAFGEGIVSDIEDYNAHLKREAELAEWASKENAGFWKNSVAALTGLFDSIKESMGSSEEEAKNEIKNFAKDAASIIRDELGEEGLKDKIQVNEAIARVIRGFEQQFPSIRGKGKALFETMFNDIMAEEFGKSFDKQAYYYNKFLDQLKKDHASAFGDVTDDILKDTHKWTSAQKDAIEKTAEKVRKDLPEASQSAIDEILRQLNSTEFKVRIVAEMATTSLDKVQQQFKDKYINKPWVSDDKERERQEAAAQQKYGTLMRKNTESNAEYEKRISDERKKQLEISQKNADIIEKNKNKQDAYSKAVLEDAKIQKQTADDWLTTAKEIEEAGGYDFRTKQETKKPKGNKKDLILEALKQEIQLVEKLQSDYDKLAKSGASQSEALATIRGAYGNTIKKLNTELGSYGLPTIDITRLIVGKDPNKSLEHFKNTLNSLINKGMLTLERSKEVEAIIEKLTLSAKTYNLDMITKGLNNELGKLKEEYELAVELDANPELGGMFADIMGLNIETLPRTIEEYAKKYTERLNKYLRDTKSGIELPSLNLTNDDLRAFEEMVEQDKLSQAVYENIKKGVLAVRDLKKKDISETTKEWNSLIDKYGKLEAKILKITKDTSKERLNVINKFGTDEQKKNARNLVNMLSISEDPSEVSRLQTELTNLLKDVVAKNPKAVDVSGAIANEQSSLTSKAYWEDFKNSELYTMTFEDMSRNSTRAIQLIIDKLEQLKGKVKEDPASMKALSKSLQDARKELESRSSTTTLVEASKEMKAATEDVTSAKKRLAEANREVSDAEQELGSSTEGTKAYANAVERLRIARERQEEAEIEYAKSSNKAKAAQEKMKAGLETLSNELNNVQNLFKVVADLFADAGDDDTAEAINAISQGFAVMTTVIMGVVAAMVLLETTQPYLLAIAAALSVVVGLVSFLSGNSNKKITEQVEKSERAVKRLEIAYKDLEDAATHAYGAITMGVNRVTLANKELQLVELKRQIQLEKSRDSKYRDQDKILDLEGQYKDLLLEIKNGVEDIVNEMLGVSSAGDAATQLVEAMIDAFREGEDAMKAFSDKWDEMIDNMILKLIISQYMQKAWDNVMKTLNDKEEEFLAKSSSDKAEAQYLLEKYSSSFGEWLVDNGLAGYSIANDETKKTIEKAYQDYLNSLRDRIAIADKANEQASEDYLKWSLDYMMGEGRDYMEGVAENLIEGLGDWYKFGDKTETSLSALQAGIQNISESTAEALEAYMNGVSQQVYLQSEYLRQIVDVMTRDDNPNDDIEVASLSQILLQLQTSYQSIMAMQNMMENWTVAAGNGIRVELMS